MAAAPKAGRVVVTDAAQAVQRRADLGEKLAPADWQPGQPLLHPGDEKAQDEADWFCRRDG